MDNFTPRARRTDAASSIEAARQLESSGTIDQQQARVLAAVRAFPGQSSLAIAEHARLDRHLVARRLPELGRMGLVIRGPLARCAVSDRLALTWSPK